MSKQIINTEQHPGAWLNIVFDFEKISSRSLFVSQIR